MTKRILFKCIPILFGIFMYAMPKTGYSQVGNIAPQATVTGSSCQTGPCSVLNDLNLGTCGTQQMWVQTATPPSTVPGVDWIQWDFPSVQTFDTLIIHHAQTTGRFLTGATVQYWDGAAWVTHTTFSNLSQANCVNKVPIGILATDRFRITSFIPGTGQTSNMNFREIEIIAASTGSNDAAVLSVDSPRVFCAGVENVIATIANLGVNQIDSVDVNWEVNGVAQPTFRYIGLLDTATGTLPFQAQVTLGTFNFSAGTSTIRVFTSNPNGIADTSNFNDTVQTSVQTAIAPPQAVVTNATLTTATATLGNASGIDYVVVPFGSPVTSGTVVSNISSPFTMTGLTASTLYDLYVRKNCGAMNVSAWVGPTSFNTAYGIPFFQDFELFPTNTAIASEGWTNTNGIAAPSWRPNTLTTSGGTGPAVDHTIGAGGIFVYLETSSGAGVDTLYSPPIFIDSILTTVELEFWYHMHGAAMGSLEVYADTNGVQNLLTTYVGQQHPTQTDPWLSYSSFLNGYNGKSVTIKFVGIRGTSFTSDMAIDDVRLDPVLPLDAGITDVIAPSGSLCPGNVTPIVEVRNYGSNQIDSVKVLWDVNGVLDSINYIGTIAPGARVPVTLGTLNINATTVYNITFSTKDPNGGTDMFPSNDDLVVNGLRTGLNGAITLDPALAASSTNFIDFASLESALNNYGVCGPTTVTVAPGVYNETIIFDAVPGSSPVNTLTIDGVDSSLVTLENNLSNTNVMVEFSGSHYITVKNMTINCLYTGTLDHSGVHFNDSASYDSLVNCRVLMNPTATFNSMGIAASSDPGNDFSEGNNAFYNVIMGNTVEGGDYSIHFEGGSLNDFNVGNQFINNVLINYNNYGMYLDNQSEIIVRGNDVRVGRSLFGDGIAAFEPQNFEFNENKVIGQDYGIWLVRANTQDTTQVFKTGEVINNMVIQSNATRTFAAAIEIERGYDIAVLHNSTYAAGGRGMYFDDGFGAPAMNLIDCRNNIFKTDGDVAFQVDDPDTVFIKLNNNCYESVAGPNTFSIDAVTYPDLLSYQAAQALFNNASLEGDPQYLSATDLHIIGGFVNDTGDNSVNVLIDIDGDTRPILGSTVVDLGADEFDPPTCLPITNLATSNSTLTSIDLSWTGVSGSYQYEYMTTGSPLGSGTSALTTNATVTISGLTASTQYDFYVREICGRGDTSLWIGPITEGTANGVPYLQTFEAFTVGNSVFEEGWINRNGTLGPNWQVNTRTGSFATGPEQDHTIGAGGKFIYLETSTGAGVDTLVSPPIYFDTSQVAVTLEYWIHMHGAAMGSMEVYADTNGVLIPLNTLVGQQTTNQLDPWTSYTHSLGGLQDQTVRLKFVGIRGTSFTSDMAVDDVRLFIPAAADGGVTAVIRPGTGCGLTAADSVEVTITNFGTGAISNFPVSYVINSGTPVTETFTGSVAAGTTANYTFTTTANLAAFGSYTLTSYTSVPSDGDLTNDTITVSFDNIPQVAYPYFEDFETTNGGWTVDGTNASWAWGAPTGVYIPAAAAGTNAWVTNLSGQHNNNEQSYIVSPCIDLSGQTQDVTIYFDHIFETETNFDEGWLEESTNGGQTWTKVLGNAAQNWYNNTVNQYWETANTSGTGVWDSASTVLTGSATQANYRLRFVFSSDGSVTREGFGVDNFAIGITTGLDEESTALVNGFNVSPNPSKGLFTLRLESEKIENLNVTVRDLDGKKVYEDNISVNGTYREDIDLTNLAKGVYFMQVMSGEETRVEKLVIQ